MHPRWIVALVALGAACSGGHRKLPVRAMPAPSIQVGACGEPGRDGVMGRSPKVDRSADRDLDGDGTPEPIVVDRTLCTPEGNCYWNVFVPPRGAECARYAGTFEAAALEPLPTRGDDNMRDVRAYFNQSGGRLLLQSYRFMRGGYQIVDVIQCKRGPDDRLECADHER
ncbi:MAG: hypothetical protein KF773_28435 [Deltaproteobacteria bacterium]|nr:hypothetical protein [Deltaproteobacteria bacterium]MCW5801868.1 hypothetical protein [Deltaproteobacteria bacterium]